jgi:hypothetical protein
LYPDLLSSTPKKLTSVKGERSVDPINAVDHRARPAIAHCVRLLFALGSGFCIAVFVETIVDVELLLTICQSNRSDINPAPRCSVTRLSSVKTELLFE